MWDIYTRCQRGRRVALPVRDAPIATIRSGLYPQLIPAKSASSVRNWIVTHRVRPSITSRGRRIAARLAARLNTWPFPRYMLVLRSDILQGWDPAARAYRIRLRPRGNTPRNLRVVQDADRTPSFRTRHAVDCRAIDNSKLRFYLFMGSCEVYCEAIAKWLKLEELVFDYSPRSYYFNDSNGKRSLKITNQLFRDLFRCIL